MPCGPNCQKDHEHDYIFDFSKNFSDALEERPGHSFLNLAPRFQSPIDLPTQMQILAGFKDDLFHACYEEFDPAQKKRFDEQNDRFFYELSPDDYMLTKTPGLFDEHLSEKMITFYGRNAHFHAPSEHSIDGKLLDLELHVVHEIETDFKPGKNGGSQFGNAVLGFLFMVVPDEEFDHLDDYHDRFLSKMVADFAQGQKEDKMIDFYEFVRRLNKHRRWTYPGSLTTAPFNEGILWNVIEQAIPIRQSTLDEFVAFKKIEEHQVVNRFESKNKLREHYDKNAKTIPQHCRPFCTEHDCSGQRLFRTAFCNRPVQDLEGRPVYHIDVDQP